MGVVTETEFFERVLAVGLHEGNALVVVGDIGAAILLRHRIERRTARSFTRGNRLVER